MEVRTSNNNREINRIRRKKRWETMEIRKNIKMIIRDNIRWKKREDKRRYTHKKDEKTPKNWQFANKRRKK